MKQLLLFCLVFILLTCLSIGKEVDPETAKLVAQNLYQQVDKKSGDIYLELIYTCESIVITDFNSSTTNEFPILYVFNAGNNKGFVIVSGDDNVLPVLGYSLNGNFDKSNMPSNFKKWLEGYKNQISHIIVNKLSSTDEIKSQWEKLKNGQSLSTDITPVNPLLSTTWDQSPHYNALCPYDYSYNELTVTGCVATAMAQIMKYWNYPANGTGFHSYNHPVYGTLSANFASATYEWGSMPNNVTSSNNAVATLMYHCGVSVEMNYGIAANGGSSTNSLQPVANALGNYFQYSNTVQFVERASFSNSDWINMLKSELDAGRPIEYGGIGSGGGHAFVCDGYDANNYFHMNWGWSGYYDGYFLIDELNPGGTGTGGGSGGYNSYQQAVIGIKAPTGNTTYEMSLYENVVASPNPIYYTQGFTVHTDIVNWGTNTFNGDFCAAIFDAGSNFIDYVEILTGYSLGGGMHYTNGLDFTNSGLVTLLPGSYYIGIFYRQTGGDWIIVDDGSYSNMITLNVEYSNDIELYQEMNISCGNEITQNQAFTVTLDVANYGTTTFSGEFALNVYNLEGYFEETVQILTGAYLEPNYFYDDIEFTTNGLGIAPGTYLLALLHKEDGGDWELSGSTYYSNPVFVTIKEQSLSPDNYEDNNVQNNAYNLTVNFNGNNATVETTGSNLHVGSDDDFYKIELISEFDYTISARAHDSYNSGNGQTYTCDVAWSYNNGIVWSDLYDDIMPQVITVNDGGTVYFRVAPYFVGQAGTYLLDINITRTETGINDVAFSRNLSVYPNPATELLNIEVKNNARIKEVKIFDMAGKQLLKVQVPVQNNSHITIPVNELPYGVYMMLIQTEETLFQHKFIKGL